MKENPFKTPKVILEIEIRNTIKNMFDKDIFSFIEYK